MVLSDFLSRQNHNDSSPHEIISNFFQYAPSTSQKILQHRKHRKLFGTNTIPNQNLMELSFQKLMA